VEILLDAHRVDHPVVPQGDPVLPVEEGHVAVELEELPADRLLLDFQPLDDLPLLDVGDVSVLREAVASGRDVIAPSSDGGTSAISSTDAVLFSFGAASFHRHLPRLTDPVIVARVGLLHDLDSGKDLRSALRHPKGHWLRPFVEGWSDLVGDSSRTFPR
jgi:2-phospho-L-lactate guanylyltransferase (CobY/MobA/RfbA family)